MTTDSLLHSQVEQGDLPAGWRWGRLDDICQRRVETRDLRCEEECTFTYVDISSVDNMCKRIVAPKQLRGAEAPSRARQVIRAGDVLVATTRPNLNAVALVPPDLDGEICSTGFCVLRPTKDIDSQFLFSFVQSPQFLAAVSALVKGAMYPAVTDGQVRSQMLPLPPLPEQRRIATALTAHMADIQRVRECVEAQLQAARELPSALLREVFDSAEAQAWPLRHLGDVLELRKDVVYPRDNPKRDARFVGLEHIESGTGIR